MKLKKISRIILKFSSKTLSKWKYFLRRRNVHYFFLTLLINYLMGYVGLSQHFCRLKMEKSSLILLKVSDRLAKIIIILRFWENLKYLYCFCIRQLKYSISTKFIPSAWPCRTDPLLFNYTNPFKRDAFYPPRHAILHWKIRRYINRYIKL